MDGAEALLQTRTDQSVVSVADIRSSGEGGFATEDEATAALVAMAELGIVEEQAGRYRVCAGRLRQTEAYRRGVRDSLDLPSDNRVEEPQLCVALPARFPAEMLDVVRQCSVDLRASLIDVVASARQRIVIASPFWDAETAADLEPALLHRLDDGVKVDLLGRFGVDAPSRAAVERLSRHPDCSACSWYETDPEDVFGSRTFHFKAVVADDGWRAYLGTANLTRGGLRSRLEIGVLLSGRASRRLSTIVDAALSLATVLEPGTNWPIGS